MAILGTLIAGTLVAGTVIDWLVPAIMFLVVIVAALVGLRWIRSEHLEALRAVPLFSLLSERELRSLLGTARAVSFPPRADIVKQGEPGKDLFIMKDGTAKVVVDGDQVATLGAGAYFGEMSLIDGGPRTATITAESAVSTLEIGHGSFTRLLNREPMIANTLYGEMVARLNQAGVAVEDSAGDGRVDKERLNDLCQQLRHVQHPDWSQVPTKQRRLHLSGLFAHGS